MLSDKGQLEEGLRLGARVPTDEQATVDQLMTKAQAYFACGPSAKAIPLYERVISMEPSHQGAHFFLAITFAWSGEYARCIEQGETYFYKFGEDPEVHLWVAVSHDALGNVEEAAVPLSTLAGDVHRDFRRVAHVPECRQVLHANR